MTTPASDRPEQTWLICPHCRADDLDVAASHCPHCGRRIDPWWLTGWGRALIGLACAVLFIVLVIALSGGS